MIETPKTDKLAMWADSTTGDYFQCVHLDDAREMEVLLRDALNGLITYSNNDTFSGDTDRLISKIKDYLED